MRVRLATQCYYSGLTAKILRNNLIETTTFNYAKYANGFMFKINLGVNFCPYLLTA